MNIIKLENKIQTITNDEHFKIIVGDEALCILDALQNIIDSIGKLNDAIGNVEFVKQYYADLFTSRNKHMNFIVNCEDLSHLLERKRRELILDFQDFIEEILRNEELQEIIKDDFPQLMKVIKKIKEDKNELVGIYEVIFYLDKWLDVISYDDPDNCFIDSLDKEFEDFYKLHFE